MHTRLRAIAAKAQSFTGTTRSELLVVAVLLLGLLAGSIGRRLFTTHPNVQSERSEILRISDSLAAAEITTFAGTTPDGEPSPELAARDTVVQKTLPYALRAAKPNKIVHGRIHLSTATVQDLMRLPGVGKVTAEKIVGARTQRKFVRIEDIMRVKGIGKKKFEALQPFVEL